MNHKSPIESPNLTRRQALQTLAAGAVAAAISSTSRTTRAASPSAPPQTQPIKLAATPRAEPFDLTEVRLLESPFLQAQKRDAKYLLDLEPDRMLHNFRINAGLEPKAPVYGGWESVATWADVRAHGHTLGHYLTACALMYASTGDDAFKKRCDYIIADLNECQIAGKMGAGLICAFPDKATQIDNLIAGGGRRVIGVPWYTLHKIMAGLRDAYLYTHNPAALDILIKLSDWTQSATQDMTDAQFQRMLNTEHGGMNEVLADLHILTGNPKYLQLAQRFCHHLVLDPLAQQRDTLNGLHSNTQIPKFIGFHRLYQITAQPDYLAASKFFWQTITNTRSFATGGNGDQEHFFPINTFAQHLGSAKTMETCCSYNMLRLTRSLFTLDPSATYADYYERTLYNTILASQDPDSGMMTYFQPTRPGYLKIYCTPIDSFWCCTGTGMENHAKYGDSIYFRDNQSLYINLFIPSTLTWKQKGLTLTQTTTFPDQPSTRFTLTAAPSTEFTLHLRHPAWCKTVTIKLNGQPLTTSTKPGYIPLTRTCGAGDTLDVDLPMTLHTELLPGTTDTVALLYGPIVLAGKLGTKDLTPNIDIQINERLIGNTPNTSIGIPSLTGDPATITDTFKSVSDKPLNFTTAATNRPDPLTLIPYFRIAHERYNMYWKVISA